MQATNRANVSAFQLLASVLAAALIATATPASAGESAATQPTAMPARSVGIFTGKYETGVPVYRLPPVTVVASRKVELARMAREETLTRAKTARPSVSMPWSAPATDKATLALSARDK